MDREKRDSERRWWHELGRREFLRATGLAALSLGIPLSAGCDDEQPAINDGSIGSDGGDGGGPGVEPFMVVALPDTQMYADHLPELYTAQTKWIADNLEKERIAFVTHLGDVVDNGPSVRQWKNAMQSMKLLDEAKVPYGICLGNHDIQYSDSEFQYPPDVDNSCSAFIDIDCKALHFLDAFGPDHFKGMPWFGGASPSGLSSFQTVTIPGNGGAAGIELLFLHVAVDFPKAELTWAQKVVDGHPEAAIHVSTHRYMYDFRVVKGLQYPLSTLLGGRYNDMCYLFDNELYYNDSITANEFFAQFIAKNTNIFMVECGHVDGEYRQVSKNAAGLPVHEIMANFQAFSPNGGDGWMRLMRFDISGGTIQVRTYSPSLKKYRENGSGFDESVNAQQMLFNAYADKFKALIDVNALKQKLDYWSNDPAGRKEYYDLLYSGGERDSDFTLEVDLAAYPKSRAS